MKSCSKYLEPITNRNVYYDSTPKAYRFEMVAPAVQLKKEPVEQSLFDYLNKLHYSQTSKFAM